MGSLGQPGAGGQGMAGAGLLFDKGKLRSAVEHANDVCSRYGVEVISINIISAFPKDARLVESLAAGAIAAAEAEQAETCAQGAAKALMIRTQADADAERIRADGSKDAAHQLEKSAVAVDLARIQKAGEAISDKQSFFFGADGPAMLPAILSNGGLVSRSDGAGAKPARSGLFGL